MSLRRRFTLAAGAAALALLALPSLASARPGTAPGLVQRSGRLVVLHADRPDGTSTQAVDARQRYAPRARATPGRHLGRPRHARAARGQMQDGALVLADSLSAVQQEGAAPPAAAPLATAAAPALHSTAGHPDRILSAGRSRPNGGRGSDRAVGHESHVRPGDGRFGDVLLPGTDLRADRIHQCTVFATVTIASPTTTCTMNDIYNWSALAEHEAGVSDQAYQHYVFVFPKIAACVLDRAGGDRRAHVWINGAMPSRPTSLAHELGHNLGLAACGRAALPERRGGGPGQQHVRSSRAPPVRRPVRRNGARARPAADEHAAQARSCTCSRPRR